MSRPVAVTCGDPAGVGPEIIAAAWARLRGSVSFFVLFDPRCQGLFGIGSRIREIDSPEEAPEAMPHGIPVIRHEFAVNPRPGKADLSNADSIKSAISRAVDYALEGSASAVCTAPVNKHVLRAGAGFEFGGQTEFLANACGRDFAVMMLESPLLRVVPTTRHCAIAEISNALSQQLIFSTIEVTHESLRSDFGIPAPRIAVSGLNPHAGESGLFGSEESSVIQPALDRLRLQGMKISGPLPADGMFHQQARRQYDAAVCMFHDQALIPLKALDFFRGVNVTLGLPIVRTSPDHGTAFELAGRGVANSESITRAIRLASRMSETRKRDNR